MQVEGQTHEENTVENGTGEAQAHTSTEHETPTEEPQGSETPEQAYTPNYRFKVLDEEKEFEDWVKPLIKDQDSEQRFREMYERAFGIEHVKADRQTLREENTQIKNEVSQYRQVLGQIQDMRQKGDWDSYFEALEVPKEVILKQAKKLVDLHQDPQAAAQYERERQQHWQSVQSQEYQATMQQQLSEMRAQQVDMAITYSPYASFVQEFDQRVGRPGAFKEEVYKAGVYHWNTTRQDLPVQDAINQVLALAGYQANTPQNQTTYNQPQAGNTYAPGQGHVPNQHAPGQASPTQSPGAQARPPVLPNISGSGGSPVKDLPRSIDDLRRRRDALG